MKKPLPKITGGRVLADWVTESLREAILKGYFEPGEKLDQDQIAAELKVSRTPVREALKVLESEGFIELRPHRGAFITFITRQDIHDVYEIRSLLEAEAVRQVTSIISDTVLDDLERSLEEEEAQLKSQDHSQHFVNDTYFHATILDLVENELLKDVLSSLGNRIIRVRRFALLQPGSHLTESLQEHHAILRAMRQRDAKEASRAMKEHLEKSAARIQQLSHE
jgi:DNA-binding GntR family transcriptional regulator